MNEGLLAARTCECLCTSWEIVVLEFKAEWVTDSGNGKGGGDTKEIQSSPLALQWRPRWFLQCLPNLENQISKTEVFLFIWPHFFPASICLSLKREHCWASLMVQWLGIHLPKQGTQAPSLVQEDSTCRGATKPMYCRYRSQVPRACAPQLEKACV